MGNFDLSVKKVSMVRKYHNHTLQGTVRKTLMGRPYWIANIFFSEIRGPIKLLKSDFTWSMFCKKQHCTYMGEVFRIIPEFRILRLTFLYILCSQPQNPDFSRLK